MERIEKYGVILALLAQVAAIVWWSASLSQKVEHQALAVDSHALVIVTLDRKVAVLETQLDNIHQQLENQSTSLREISASIKK